MNNIKVSAIITTFNRLELLKRAIDSVLRQTYPNIECIVISDGSSDGTCEYCQSLSNIIFVQIPKEERKGGNHARNIGIQKSTGDYIAFLDDDDYWLPTKIDKQVKAIVNKGEAYVYTLKQYEIVKKDGSLRMHFDEFDENDQGDVSKRILQKIITTTSCIFVSKKALLSVGCFDDNLAYWQEYELSIRIAQILPFICIQEPLVIYRIDVGDPNRLTNKYDSWKLSVKYIYKKHSDLYATLGIKEKINVIYLRWHDAIARTNAAGLYTKCKLYKIGLRVLRPIDTFNYMINKLF